MQQRSKGAPVSGPILQEKSLQLFPKLYPQLDMDLFKASSGCLQQFCHRHGIRSVKLQGEMLSADTSMVDPYRRDLQSLIEKVFYVGVYFGGHPQIWGSPPKVQILVTYFGGALAIWGCPPKIESSNLLLLLGGPPQNPNIYYLF